MFEAGEDEKTESLLAEIMAKLNKLQEQLDNFQLTEAQLQSIMTQVIAALSGKYYTSEQINEKFSKLQEGIGQSFSSMSNTINQQNNKFAEIESQFNQINEKIETSYITIDPLFGDCEFNRKGWAKKIVKRD